MHTYSVDIFEFIHQLLNHLVPTHHFVANLVCCKNTPCVVTLYFKLQCYHHCLLLEENLTRIAKETAAKGANCFPIIVGKRPSVFGGKENVVNIKPEKHVSHMPEVVLLHHLHFVYLFIYFLHNMF